MPIIIVSIINVTHRQVVTKLRISTRRLIPVGIG